MKAYLQTLAMAVTPTEVWAGFSFDLAKSVLEG